MEGIARRLGNRRTSLFSAHELLAMGNSTSGVERRASETSEKSSVDGPDLPTLQEDMAALTAKVRTMEDKVEKICNDAGLHIQQGPACKSVAFTVGLKTNTIFNALETIKFDNVVTNYGRAFDMDTGIFTVPVPGRYLFSLTVRAQFKKQVCAEIIAVGETIGQLAAGDTEIERASASMTSIAFLDAGDEVFVREAKTWTGYFFGEGYTIFTGVLLD